MARPLRPTGLTARWSEPAAVALVAVVAALAWHLVSGAATGVYRHHARYGDPTLRAIPVPAPDPAAPDGPSAFPSQLGHYGYFWSERAFHYRTTLAFATGRPDPATLSRDTAQQHPDGVDQWREYTLLMEPLYGLLYRLAGDQGRPLVEFLLGLVPLVHVLGFLALYAAARVLGVRPPVAVAAVLVAATCRLGIDRLVGSLLLKETLALLLLQAFLALHLAAWRGGRRTTLLAAGAVLVPLLASWHLAQMLVAVLLGASALMHAAGDAPAPRWRLPAAYVAAALLAGLTPSLFERRFLLDVPFALLVAWLAAAWLAERRPGWGAAARVGALAAAVVVLVGPALVWPGHGGDYGHVFGLLRAKLAHGFALPDDPTALPFAVRLFWTRPFHAPPPAEVWSATGVNLALLLGGLAYGGTVLLRRRSPPAARAVHLSALVFFAAWLTVARLGVVFLPFGALATALAADGLGRRRAAWWPAAVLAAVAAVNVATHLSGPRRIAAAARAGRPALAATEEDDALADRVELFRWLTHRTPGPGSPRGGPPAAVLADIALSPQVLLYTGRPVVLNSQFENTAIRRRYRRFLDALYHTDPARLHAFAREHRADYLVVARRMATGDSPRTVAWVAAAERPLHRDQTAVRLHFAPTRVPGFAPVWDNDRFRVFRVLPAAVPPGDAVWERGFAPVWEAANYRFADGRLIDLEGDRERLARVDARARDLQDRQRRILADQARRQPGRPDLLTLQRRLALLRLEAATSRGAPPDPAAAQLANAVQAALSEVDPATGRSVGRALGDLLDGGPRGPGWRQLLDATVGLPERQAVAGQLAATAGRYEDAAALFAAAAARWGDECGPGGSAPAMRRQLWDEAVLWLVAAGRPDAAREFAARRRPCVEAGEGPGALVHRLAADGNERR